MLWLIAKYAMTAGMVVLISELAKRSDHLGGLIAALPIVTVLVLIWMKLENQDPQKISNHAWYTFWYVVPTLPMFLLFPILYARCSFWLTLMICCIVTIVLFFLWSVVLHRFGIDLM
jgi:small-conductance mechanosensitive channel